ncbi:hypothetical protein [Mycolicibacter arupensis]|uniref:hypothetical protein n=1 Tax=Mycolicibacter arupensis TaxID=342002 RepID=UPI00122C6F66|nr:hypothetical protein [Mycolicibacter arupensis]KAA1430079.1 hypothetical protein F0402_15815 [Mycolicibacter arupensis]
MTEPKMPFQGLLNRTPEQWCRDDILHLLADADGEPVSPKTVFHHHGGELAISVLREMGGEGLLHVVGDSIAAGPKPPSETHTVCGYQITGTPPAEGVMAMMTAILDSLSRRSHVSITDLRAQHRDPDHRDDIAAAVAVLVAAEVVTSNGAHIARKREPDTEYTPPVPTSVETPTSTAVSTAPAKAMSVSTPPAVAKAPKPTAMPSDLTDIKRTLADGMTLLKAAASGPTGLASLMGVRPPVLDAPADVLKTLVRVVVLLSARGPLTESSIRNGALSRSMRDVLDAAIAHGVRHGVLFTHSPRRPLRVMSTDALIPPDILQSLVSEQRARDDERVSAAR